MLSCLTGIDNGPEAATMEVVYNLYSIPFNHHVALKVILPRENPVVDSVIDIWKTANWHERELFDMYGITVNGHPDMRRILMPADWEGYPLRKDYRQQEYYRDIKIEY
jgi:NADH-quinone oxidoreductase subunit C